MNIELTPEQANKAIALIDVAVKAVGINAAKDALEIAQIIQAALVAEQQEQKE